MIRLRASTILAAAAMLVWGPACLDAGEQPDSPAVDDSAGALFQHPSRPRPTVVLVHGAFADGGSWRSVIPLLERRGYPVVAVQDPLTSVADDVATAKRVIDAASLKGPVIVVAHSFGGVAVTGAAAGNPQVKALVYVDAYVPEVGEILGELANRFPGPLAGALIPDTAGFLYIDRAKFHYLFCADLPEVEARILAASQRPVSGAVFMQAVNQAAWKSIPSWYLLGRQDRTVVPELQRFMAKRAGARITEIDSSHVAYISHPRVVLRLIEEAAASTVR